MGKEFAGTYRFNATKADSANAEQVSPPSEPIPRKTAVSKSAILEIHDRHTSTREDMLSGTAWEGMRRHSSNSYTGAVQTATGGL